MSTVTVAAVQLAASDDRATNLDRAEEFVRDAASRGARLIVLPEIFSAPFVAPEPDLEYFRWAEPLDGPSNQVMRRLSESLGTSIVSPIFETTNVAGIYHNTACTFTNGQLVYTYRKSHLPFSNGFPEKFYFRPGNEPPTVFALADVNVNVGMIICYERHFPELGRLVALQGADVMCVPVACASESTKHVFQLELAAQAAFNSMYVICANRVGTEGSKRYYGLSAIYAPDGRAIAACDDREGVVMADIDTETVRERRHILPFLRDRRTDLYARIAESD